MAREELHRSLNDLGSVMRRVHGPRELRVVEAVPSTSVHVPVDQLPTARSLSNLVDKGAGALLMDQEIVRSLAHVGRTGVELAAEGAGLPLQLSGGLVARGTQQPEVARVRRVAALCQWDLVKTVIIRSCLKN